MIPFLLIVQILLPVSLIIWLAFAQVHSMLGFIIQACATAIALVVIARMGIWMIPPWWSPYLYGVLFLLAVFWALRSRQSKDNRIRRIPKHWVSWLICIGWTAFGVYMANEAFYSLLGSVPPKIPAIDLTFPHQSGEYLIVNGGSDLRINAHLKTQNTTNTKLAAYRGNGYAIDIVKVNTLGLRAKGITPRDPTAYFIYGEPVLAPCAGTIIKAVDGLPDMLIPEYDRQNLSGNHVILRCDGIDILLAHFRTQSIIVQAGQAVKVGDRLAAVGNSGGSDEPHLHIHAQRPGSPEKPIAGDPLPMKFAGRFLIRGDRVTIPN